MKNVLELDDLSFDPFCVPTALWTIFISFVNGHSNTHRIKFSENYVRSHTQSSQGCLRYRTGAQHRFAGSNFKETFYCKSVALSASFSYFSNVFCKAFWCLSGDIHHCLSITCTKSRSHEVINVSCMLMLQPLAGSKARRNIHIFLKEHINLSKAEQSQARM